MSPLLGRLALLAAAGAVGTLARYGLQGAAQRFAGGSFPWGTALVNLAGCALFGVVWAAASERHLMGPEARLVVLVGFFGAFTTFSTFAFETVQMLRAGQWVWAAGNAALQNGGGVLALGAGILLGRLL